jgi:flagellar biosynthesis/type III secretory pathway protein FliH
VMKKYPKFVFQELPHSSILNRRDFAASATIGEGVDVTLEQRLQDTVNAERDFINEDESVPTEGSELSGVNFDQLKSESYNNGFECATAQYEEKIKDLTAEKNFLELIKTRLLDISPPIDIDQQLLLALTKITIEIAKKLRLILPIDFEKLLQEELVKSVTKFYKSGSISLAVHPSRYTLSQESLNGELPSTLAKDLTIVSDEALAIDDCKIEWSGACFKYTQMQIDQEVTKILEQLQNIA